MKNIFITAFLVVFLINNSIAQKRDVVTYKQNWDQQNIFWGYYLGINKKDFKINYKTPEAFVNVTSSAGFEVGLIGD